MQVTYPKIQQLPDGTPRPIWSVMIPTYNGTQYLEQTLRSVLDQDPGLDQMQIEIVDDCSTKDDPRALVEEIGQGRITFFRQPRNVGLIENWNTCIQRAKGHWVHILHQDDLVLPGFYERLASASDPMSSVGAAFCRHEYIDQGGNRLFSSLLERETPGVLLNWLPLIAIMQRVQCPSIMVKRSTYEQIGGYCPEARSAADWEMWKRIAAHHLIWYEPEILAYFRWHSASESSTLIKTGTNIIDTRRAIKISEAYLPDVIAKELTQKAKEHYASSAMSRAKGLIDAGQIRAALNQVREAFRCSFSLRVVRSLFQLFKRFVKRILSQLGIWSFERSSTSSS